MNRKILIVVLVTLSVAVTGAFMWFKNRPANNVVVASNTSAVAAVVSAPAEVSASAPVAEPEVDASDKTVPAISDMAKPAHLKKVLAAGKAGKAGKAPKQKPEIQDPMARVALSSVGADPEAEAYWLSAINDPNLPAEERKDLIEDLNEDGLSDPHHPGANDMPLIASRIQLIEEQAPYATDPVNIAAYQEAYKDLLNLYNGLPAN